MSDKSELELLSQTTMPQNIKDNETISKLMEIYFATLEEQQEINTNPTKLLDLDFLSENSAKGAPKANTYKSVKNELFKIHLDEIYKIFEDVQDSDRIFKKYKEIYTTLGIETDNLKIDFNLEDEINDEYITASNSFKAKKGTKAGFFFVNDIINKVNIDPLNADPFFKIEEGLDGDSTVPYAYTVKASLYKEVFKETILLLSHPIGFEWHFLRLLYLSLRDYFGLIETKTMTDLSLTCHSLDDSTINRQVILKKETNSSGVDTVVPGEGADYFGHVKNFLISTDQENREKVVIDFYAINPYERGPALQNGFRIVRDYDGHVIIYTKQDEILHTVNGEDEILNLELESVKLLEDNQGELVVYKKKKLINGIEKEVIDSVSFKEYSIFNLSEVKIKISFVDGTSLKPGEELTDATRNWTVATVKLENKVISSDVKYFEKVLVTRKALIDYTNDDYDGRIVDDRSLNCKLTYSIDYKYEVTTSDVSEYVSDTRKKAALTNINNENYIDNDENTVEEFDRKETLDNWARLDPNNGATNIGEIIQAPSLVIQIGDFPIAGGTPINDMDKGRNWSTNRDATSEDIVYAFDKKDFSRSDYLGIPLVQDPNATGLNNPNTKRNEAYYSPSEHKDLTILSEASNENSNYDLLDGQKTISSMVPIYIRQNKGNETYAAQEFSSHNETFLMTSNETASDPLYSKKDDVRDPGDVGKGVFGGYALIGDSHQIVTNKLVDDNNTFVIGGFEDFTQNRDGECKNPNTQIYTLDSLVDADPVNLQLNTYDCNKEVFYYGGGLSSNKPYVTDTNGNRTNSDINDDNFNYSGDARSPEATNEFNSNGSIKNLNAFAKYKTNEDGKDSGADEKTNTFITYAPYEDNFNFSQTDWVIGDYEGHDLQIGVIGATYDENGTLFNILGKRQDIDDTLYALGETKYNRTTLSIEMNRETEYAYNNFSNATGNIGDFTINDNSEIGGHIYTETGVYEVYQAVWNTNEWDSDKIEGVNETKRMSDTANYYYNEDDKKVFHKQYIDEVNEGVETVFADETNNTVETHAPTEDNFNLANGGALIGDGMLIGNTLDPNADPADPDALLFYIGGQLVEIQDEGDLESADFIIMGNNSNTELVVDNPLVIGDGTIGSTYIKARLVTYSGRDEESYMNVGDFDIFSDEDDFSFGVYKNNGDGTYTLISDNNIDAAA